jgi:HEPN domain-containing protein
LAEQKRMVEIWFGKSAQDLQTAKLLLSQNSQIFWGPLVFHSQQAAEKAIKGYLVFHKTRFTKTHDIEVLLNLVAKIDDKLCQELQSAKTLTRYAISYRYPEENEPPETLSQQSCDKIVAMVQDLYERLSRLCGVNRKA